MAVIDHGPQLTDFGVNLCVCAEATLFTDGSQLMTGCSKFTKADTFVRDTGFLGLLILWGVALYGFAELLSFAQEPRDAFIQMFFVSFTRDQLCIPV